MSLIFTGNSPRAYCYLSNPNHLSFTTNMTCCCRLYATAFTAQKVPAFSRASSVNPARDWLWVGGNDLGGSTYNGQVIISVSSGSNVEVTGSTVLNYSTWYHVALTYDGANLICYVDGVNVGSTASTLSLETCTYPLYIGGNNNATEPAISFDPWTGEVEDVRIYDRALTAAELLCIATGGDNIIGGLNYSYALNEAAPGVVATAVRDTSNFGSSTISNFVGSPAYGAMRIAAPRCTGIPGQLAG